MQTKDKTAFKINFRPLVVVFLCLLIGEIAARKLYSGDGLYIALIVCAFVPIIIYSCVKLKFLVMLICLVSFLIGNGLYFISYNAFLGNTYEDAYISGRVCYVEYDSASSRSLLTLENVVADGDKVNNVRVSVYQTKNGDFQLGDLIAYYGDLKHAKLFTLGNFNNTNYRNNIAYTSSADIENMSIVSGSLSFDEKAREHIKKALYENMDEKYAAVSYAVLVGDKSGIDEEVYNAFSSSGIVHILTVSGLHVTFLTTLIAWVLKKCRVNRFINFIITFVLLLLYAYICGFAPSVLRAMIMGLMFIVAGLFGKRYDGPTALACAGILTILISPLSALDVGFLMSYGCVGAIYILQRPFAKALKTFLPNKVADLISLSLATQVGILPFLASFFGELNFLSFFANLIVVPFFGVLFPLLIVLVIFVMIFPALGGVLKLCQWGFIGIEYVANFFASTRFKINLKPLDPIVTAFIYIAAFACSCFLIASPFVKWFSVATVTLVLSLYCMVKPDLVKHGASASVLSSQYSQTLVLESQSGQILSIAYNQSLVKYYLASQGLNAVDYVFAPSYGNGREYGAQIVEEQQGFVGDFKYRIVDNVYVVEFDNIKILFANISDTSYNNDVIETLLDEGGYDFVYTTKYQPKSEGDYFMVTNEENKFSDYCVGDGGSFRYVFEDAKTWRID